jgi:hypothetical protein
MRIRIAVITGFLAALCLGGNVRGAAGQEWPPVTDEEKALKDCPRQPGASAVLISREEVTSHRTWSTACAYRLKVLTAAGRERANVEIPVVKGYTKVADLAARVVRPDGTAVPFTGQVFEKTVLRRGGFKVTAQTFALPDVDVGSLIDYRYRIVPDDSRSSGKDETALEDLLGGAGKPQEGGLDAEEGILFLPIATWDVQSDLYTLKARFGYEPSTWLGPALADWSKRPMIFSWTTRWLPDAAPSGDSRLISLELRDIPPFEPEELMPPESSLRRKVLLFYVAGSVGSPDGYWQEETGNWQKGLQKFMGKPGLSSVEARAAVASLTEPAAKIEALYARAQKIKNLSYDRAMTRRMRKERGIKTNRTVADVLKNGYGLRSDITRTFAAMAATAGFPSRVVRVATREDKLFVPQLCDLYGQFDRELAVVRIDGEDRFYDPATPFCPPGLIRWDATSADMLDPAGEPPSVLKKPPQTPDGTAEQALTRREFALRLDAAGTLAGTVKVRFGGQEALRLRLDHYSDDAVEAGKALEAELTEVLPAGARVALRKLDDLRTGADEVVAEFDVTLPGAAAVAGGRTLLPASPLLGPKRLPFRHERRQYPVSFAYPYRESDDIVIALPDGTAVESVPPPKAESGEWFDHSLACAVENGTTLHVRRDFRLKRREFPVSLYGAVRAAFDRIRAADEEPVMLSAAGK